VPVTGLSRPPAETAAALAHGRRGVCLRLTQDELKRGSLSSDVTRFLTRHHLTPAGVDLVMDMGPLEDMVVAGVAALADTFMRAVPQPTKWRTFTLAGTAFPKTMGIVETNKHLRVERLEWVVWRDHVRSRKPAWPRLPTFGDCGIQHPLGVEGFDPRTMQASPTIRYLARDHWLLVKGQSKRRVKLRLQFPQLAAKLAPGGALNSYFAGDTHCGGCQKVVACAANTPRLGSAEKWRLIGTAHHITSVVEQLTALPAV
jgi:hypothetical protein